MARATDCRTYPKGVCGTVADELVVWADCILKVFTPNNITLVGSDAFGVGLKPLRNKFKAGDFFFECMDF